MTATHQPCTRHWQQKQFTVGDGDAHQPASFLGVGFNVTENQTRTPLVHATQPRSKAELTERKRSRIGKGVMGGRRGGRARRCPRRLASRLDGRDSGHAGHAVGHCRDRFVHEQIAHLETQAAFSFFSFFLSPKVVLGPATGHNRNRDGGRRGGARNAGARAVPGPRAAQLHGFVPAELPGPGAGVLGPRRRDGEVPAPASPGGSAGWLPRDSIVSSSVDFRHLGGGTGEVGGPGVRGPGAGDRAQGQGTTIQCFEANTRDM